MAQAHTECSTCLWSCISPCLQQNQPQRTRQLNKALCSGEHSIDTLHTQCTGDRNYRQVHTLVNCQNSPLVPDPVRTSRCYQQDTPRTLVHVTRTAILGTAPASKISTSRSPNTFPHQVDTTRHDSISPPLLEHHLPCVTLCSILFDVQRRDSIVSV